MPDLKGSCSTSQNALYACQKIQDPRIRLMLAKKNQTTTLAEGGVGKYQA